MIEKRPLGQTGIDVTSICLGTMTWGEQNTEAEAHQQLSYACDERGVNFIDAAELYPVPPKAETQGRTEEYIGTWLQQRGRRDDLILATKACGPGEWVNYFRGGPRHTKAHLDEAIDASLARLQTDYVDLYQLHWPDRRTNFFGQLGYTHDQDAEETPIDDILTALESLVVSGKVRASGLSTADGDAVPRTKVRSRFFKFIPGVRLGIPARTAASATRSTPTASSMAT